MLYGNAKLGFAGAPSVLAWDVPKVLAKYYDPFVPSDNAYAYLIQKTWSVEEKISTGFGKLDLNQDFGSFRLRGNIAADVKYVDQSSTGNYFYDTPNKTNTTTHWKKYNDCLPTP